MNNKPLPLPDIGSLRQHPLTWCVLVLSCIPFMLMDKQDLSGLSLWFMPDNLAGLLEPFSVWRIWSPSFVHYTYGHLLTNMYLFWYFSSKIEAVSPIQLVVICTACAAISNLSQWLMTGPDFGGLSGVIYALLAYAWVMEYLTKKPLYHVHAPLKCLLLIALPIYATGWLGKYANYAHISGLVSGALCALAYLHFLSRGARATRPSAPTNNKDTDG